MHLQYPFGFSAAAVPGALQYSFLQRALPNHRAGVRQHAHAHQDRVRRAQACRARQRVVGRVGGPGADGAAPAPASRCRRPPRAILRTGRGHSRWQLPAASLPGPALPARPLSHARPSRRQPPNRIWTDRAAQAARVTRAARTDGSVRTHPADRPAGAGGVRRACRVCWACWACRACRGCRGRRAAVTHRPRTAAHPGAGSCRAPGGAGRTTAAPPAAQQSLQGPRLPPRTWTWTQGT